MHIIQKNTAYSLVVLSIWIWYKMCVIDYWYSPCEFSLLDSKMAGVGWQTQLGIWLLTLSWPVVPKVVGQEVWSWELDQNTYVNVCVFVVQTSDSIESQPFSTSHLFIVFDWFCLFICVVSQELFLVSLSLLLYSHFTLLCSLIKPFLAHFQKVPRVCLPEWTRWRLLIWGHRYLSPSPV